jgi:hypothetical protein
MLFNGHVIDLLCAPSFFCCCCFSPTQLRACRHLGLRLRDQLLAFASVCPVRLTSGQLSGLGAAFRQLSSLNLCGKVAVDGAALVELTQGLQGLQAQQSGTAAAAAAECGRRGKEALGLQEEGLAVAGVSGGPGLQCLSLDCHFVAVSAEQMQTALQHLSGLKVRTARDNQEQPQDLAHVSGMHVPCCIFAASPCALFEAGRLIQAWCSSC